MKDHFISSNHLLITLVVIFSCTCALTSSVDDSSSPTSSGKENTALSLVQGEPRACPFCVSGECNTATQISGLPIIQLIAATIIGFVWAAIFIWLYASFYESGGEGYGKSPGYGWNHAPSPVYGPSADVYGPPAHVYGPPAPVYGPPPAPPPSYGPPPAPVYGPPPAPSYGPPPAPPPVYGPPPAPSYGPPPATGYGPPPAPSPSYGPPTGPSYSYSAPITSYSYSEPSTSYQSPGAGGGSGMTGSGQLKPPSRRASLASTYSRVADSYQTQTRQSGSSSLGSGIKKH